MGQTMDKSTEITDGVLACHFDTNQDHSKSFEYTAIQTTDHYRRGQPYKVFGTPGVSSAILTLKIPSNCRVLKLDMTLNHCKTSGNGIIDIMINGRIFRDGYSEADRDNFAEQTFDIPVHLLKNENNTITIVLNDESKGVYWLSDIKFGLKHTLIV
ncbi:hypothetical protein AM593_09817, partial [Mytilus galloprovincialis]